ncbi:UDP glucoronosyl and UDP glucosyl transferase [Trichuris trichiura]|uniref:UDP-glucuronosyltransferase n=1 Tax=Trichuris trichiura TaxID=36087 RepID=A0A077ZFK0_TRITR|nr:UDP glucoronosyl and UDP glucosyl transferase [Trichuris trichiura]
MNTGPYSHDAMMQHIADDLYDKRYKVFLLQVRVFDFNMTLPKSRYAHPTLRYDYSGPETLSVMQDAQAQIWYGPVPLGGGTVNLKGVYTFQKLYEVQSAACQAALKSESYLNKIQAAHLDFIVIDYVLNECALGISAILKIPRVYLSNYPLIEVYSNTFGVPSNPSYVPAVLSPTSSRMTFVQRLQNMLIHTVTIFIRASLIWRSEKVLRSLGYGAELRAEERQAIFYATPLEFLLDGPRPLSNSVKYLGFLWSSYWMDRGRFQTVLNTSTQSWLSDKNMIIASFGTCASATRLPKQVLNSFITAFSQLKQYKVLLQMPGIEVRNNTWPSNVVAVQWIPLLDLLRSPSVKLLISHGGMSTTVEAVNNAVPMLGIPLQGDQMYNVGRLVEKGVADVLHISGLTAELLSKKLRRMLPMAANDQSLNLNQKQATKTYRRKILLLKKMLSTYQTFERQKMKKNMTTAPAFWIDWAARHFSNQEKREAFLLLKYTDQFFSYFSLDVLLVYQSIFIIMFFLAT